MRDRIFRYGRFLLLLSAMYIIAALAILIYEFWHTSPSAQAIQVALISALAYSARVVLIIGILGFLVSMANVRLSKIVTLILSLSSLVLSFCLAQYFITSRVLLGTDAFGYTWNDINTIVITSVSDSVVPLIAGLMLILIFIAVMFFSNRLEWSTKIPGSILIGSFVLLFVVALLPMDASNRQFENESEYLKAVNKLSYFVNRSVAFAFWEGEDITVSDYFFRKKVTYDDRIGSYLNRTDRLPNFVFILVEGLGRDFTGPDAMYGGFTPFLDSLAQRSLYWRNGLSNAGRTFGVLPSILGSLPYGRNGFLDFGNNPPSHHSLLSLLKGHGYRSNYFYGGNPNFDNVDLFLNYHGVDYALNENNFPGGYQKEKRPDSWGFDDKQVFRRGLEVLRESKSSPRIDVYLTLTTHEPFVVPEAAYRARFDKFFSQLPPSKEKEEIAQHRSVFECLLYTDDAVREFITRYQAEVDGTNTMFIITGDHRLIPVPQATRISRFHVPLMIYSPLLKKPEIFEGLAVHSDIPLTLLGYLSKNFQLTFPQKLAFLSGPISVEQEFGSKVEIALMRNKGEITDFISGDYYLSQGSLFKISKNLAIEDESNTGAQAILQKKLNEFVSNNNHVCSNNTWDSVSNVRQVEIFNVSQADMKFVRETFDTLIPDSIYMRARQMAFDKDYNHARICLRYLLNRSPNFHDARILLARTYGWNGEYDSARLYLKQVLQRAITYPDAYAALSDVEYWSENTAKSLEVANDGLTQNPEDLELLCRRARGLIATGKKDEAKTLLKDIIKRQPGNEMATALLKQTRP